MTTIITIVIPIGGDAGPFNLYSNIDGFITPFETNISAAALEAGYTSSLVPNGTTVIRIKSITPCTNYIDVIINLITTTTTSTSSTTTTSTSTSSTTTTTTTAVPGPTTTTTTTCKVPVFAPTNLNVDTYRNGDPIPEYVSVGTGPNAGWAALTTGAWCHYNNDPANDALYGKIYNWYAVNDPRGLAPVGYHVPTNNEWWCYYYSVNPINFPNTLGGKMKQVGLTNWTSPNTGATNSTGFTALPVGNRNGVTGSFYRFGDFATFWTASEINSTNAYYRGLYYYNATLYASDTIKSTGYTVRVAAD